MDAHCEDKSPEWLKTLSRVFKAPELFTLKSPPGMWLAGETSLSAFTTMNTPNAFDVNIRESFALEIRADFVGSPLPRGHPMVVLPCGDGEISTAASGRILKVPERQVGQYVLGTIFRQQVAYENPGNTHHAPDMVARFVVDLTRGVQYNVATAEQNACLDPGVIMCNKVYLDLHGGNAVRAVLLSTDGELFGRCMVKVVCPFCEARNSDECDCSDAFRERVYARSPQFANWGQFVRHAREAWTEHRRGTMHDVAPDGRLLGRRAMQKMGYFFSGGVLENLRQSFIDKCWSMNASSLGADHLFLLELSSTASASNEASLAVVPLDREELIDFDDVLQVESSSPKLLPGPLEAGAKKPRARKKRRHRCSECGAIASSPFNLRRHYATLHENHREFKCDECGFAFTQKQNLERHKNSVHLHKRPFQCDLCHSHFATASNLQRHLRKIHSYQVTCDREVPG
eukprot:Plantae.Rhodophyta-Rhodochaete_pulchella.ctg15437.p1 GENE.Plantae.Rhodophyta-Rhodochaete_pulchella.ctg15437~~Plantae.Rhodophyta-Rhodochaete_pulchella.ctg15437.p1  ORF type:complete len:473 (+),score=45.50 Plantae.Rhodophyta-Rhodochaete_pulchella.ctg15437:47-1420(+)